MTGGDQERATTRSEIEAEIARLAGQQTKAVKDATFMGWDPADSVAFEERRMHLVWLHKQLADLDAA